MKIRSSKTKNKNRNKFLNNKIKLKTQFVEIGNQNRKVKMGNSKQKSQNQNLSFQETKIGKSKWEILNRGSQGLKRKAKVSRMRSYKAIKPKRKRKRKIG